MQMKAKTVEVSNLYAKDPTKAQEFVKSELPHYTLEKGLTDNTSAVLRDNEKKEVVIAFRGTLLDGPEKMKDLKDDTLIALGISKLIDTKRLQEAEMKYERVKELYPDDKVVVTGHSLGGIQSYHLGTKYNIDGYHYNIGSGPMDGVFNRVQSMLKHGNEAYDRQNIFHSDYYKALGDEFVGEDPLSAGSKHLAGNHNVIKVNSSTALGSHGLHHFYRKNNNSNHRNEGLKEHYSYTLRPEEYNIVIGKRYMKKKYLHKYYNVQENENRS